MSLMRMPMFCWTTLITTVLILLAFPVFTIALTQLLFDRHFGTTFFDSTRGADPLLWQHVFWIFGHPEVYILILPAFGIVSEILPVFSRKPLFGYAAMVLATSAIAFLAFGLRASHRRQLSLLARTGHDGGRPLHLVWLDIAPGRR